MTSHEIARQGKLNAVCVSENEPHMILKEGKETLLKKVYKTGFCCLLFFISSYVIKSSGTFVVFFYIVHCYSLSEYDRSSFMCLIKCSSSWMKIEKRFHVLSSPCLRHMKVSNFTSGWVQYRSRQESGDSRAVTSVLTSQPYYPRSPVLCGIVPNQK